MFFPFPSPPPPPVNANPRVPNHGLICSDSPVLPGVNFVFEIVQEIFVFHLTDLGVRGGVADLLSLNWAGWAGRAGLRF